MAGLYIGSTGGFAGKNMIALSLGLKLQKDGHRIGYMKPVGAVPSKTGERSGDDDAFFLQFLLVDSNLSRHRNLGAHIQRPRLRQRIVDVLPD